MSNEGALHGLQRGVDQSFSRFCSTSAGDLACQWECPLTERFPPFQGEREAEQMNRSAAWFDKHYAGFTVKRLIIHPAGKIESAAAFTHEVEGVRESDLKRLVRGVQQFFKSFESRDLRELSEADIQNLINAHALQVSDLISKYSRKLKDLK